MGKGEKSTRGSTHLGQNTERTLRLGEPIRRETKNFEVRSGRIDYMGTTPQTRTIAWIETTQGLLPYGLLLLVVFLWLVSLPLIDPNAMTDIGLLAVLPVSFYAALILLTISFSLLVFRYPLRIRTLLAHLTALIVMFHGTPAILYGSLRYSWAWKHVGIVDYIQRHGSINPDISFLNAYHNWPGFFALNAFLTEATGLQSSLTYAPWAPLIFNLLFLGSLLLIYRSLTSDNRLIWTAIWFFFLTDWVGQDYFSPQSFAYFFYLVLIGILVNWFHSAWLPEESRIRRWLRHPRLSGYVHQIFRRSASSGIVQPSTPVQRLVLLSVVILLMVVTTFSHQLTPLMAISTLVLLALFRLIYVRGIPILMIVLTAAWIWLVATSFVSENLRSIFSSIGSVESNVAENLINLTQASSGQVIVAIMGRVLTVLVMLLAGIGFFRRMRNGHVDLAAVVLLIAPFFMLLANSYGGEIVFRVYFFALPFMAFFIAGLIYPKSGSGWSWRTPVMAAVLSLVLLSGFLFAYFGKEKQYYFSPGEVSAAEYLFETAPPGSLIIEGTRNYPTLFRNYELFTYVPVGREPVENREEIIQQPEEVFSRWMSNMEYPAAYLLITRSMKAEVDMVGTMPPGSLDMVEKTLKQSEHFEVLYSNPDATIFVLRNRQP